MAKHILFPLNETSYDSNSEGEASQPDQGNKLTVLFIYNVWSACGKMMLIKKVGSSLTGNVNKSVKFSLTHLRSLLALCIIALVLSL